MKSYELTISSIVFTLSLNFQLRLSHSTGPDTRYRNNWRMQREPNGEIREQRSRHTANRKADHNERLHHSDDRSHFGTRSTSSSSSARFDPPAMDSNDQTRLPSKTTIVIAGA